MRFGNIQLLRVAAAVGVVLHHLGHYAEHTLHADRDALFLLRWDVFIWLPVPLFFAVSGFVLCHALQKARPGRFLAARVLRLYPGYWLALALVVTLKRAHAFTRNDVYLSHAVGPGTLSLFPTGAGRTVYQLAIEWSLIYEVFLSYSLAVIALPGRRAIPYACGLWAAVLVAKMLIAPGFASDALPHWTTIGLSALSLPFLLGVLVYHLRDVDRRAWWPVFAAAVAMLAIAAGPSRTFEQIWCYWGVAAAMVLWLAVRMRQVNPANRFAKLGDCTYGLFLLHVPLMMLVIHAAVRAGWEGSLAVVAFAGLFSLAGGMLFGKLEAALHARLRPLANANPANAAKRLLKVRIRNLRMPIRWPGSWSNIPWRWQQRK